MAKQITMSTVSEGRSPAKRLTIRRLKPLNWGKAILRLIKVFLMWCNKGIDNFLMLASDIVGEYFFNSDQDGWHKLRLSGKLVIVLALMWLIAVVIMNRQLPVY